MPGRRYNLGSSIPEPVKNERLQPQNQGDKADQAGPAMIADKSNALAQEKKQGLMI